MRYTERALAELWQHGLVPGELHLGIGEEAAVAGVVLHLRPGDATATDHRSTTVLVGRGVPVEPLLRECTGDRGGLHQGHGGHMHLFVPELPSSSDGIVGSAGPFACGYALAAQTLRPETVSVAFFGEGAANQGMLLESWNLAVAWRLPVLFVCKDNGWAITTRSAEVTGGDLRARAAGFGLATAEADGGDVGEVFRRAGTLLDGVRAGRAAFLRVRVHRPQGHFLGDPMLRLLDHPVRAGRPMTAGLPGAATHPSGGARAERLRGLGIVSARLGTLAASRLRHRGDPFAAARSALPAGEAARIDQEVRDEVVAALRRTIAATGGTEAAR
jgi:pyruvate dehydrogenase E1 component alpha subunit